MLDLTTETPMSLKDVAKLRPLGRGNRPTHFSTVLRWILSGVKTPHGIVRLEGTRLGSKWLTTREAVCRFTDALTRAYFDPRGADGPPTPRPPAARRRASEKAGRLLENLGI
jgi:hypothetical protein